MKQVKLIIVSLSFVMVLLMVSSASAYSLEFYYFETDKLVYEVGEQIDMVSKIKADFSEDGWCYVSFTIITDMGLVYADDYYIPPSPDIRYLPSSYIIYPNETTPGLIGSQACAIFQIEVYDGILQSAGDTIDFNITRGQLEVVPETPLNIEHGTNATLLLKIISMHNSDVVFSSQVVSIEVSDMNGTSIFQKNSVSDSQGIVSLLWNSSTTLPGELNLTISGNGTDSFLSFSQSFQLLINPAASMLSPVAPPDSVFCQSSDSGHSDSVDLVVEHLKENQSLIVASNVTWKTDFSQGSMIDLGDGQYWANIEFPVPPGLYSINLTATNPLYQTAQCQVVIEALPRNVSIDIEIFEEPVAGSYLNAQISVIDMVGGSGIDSISFLINVSVNNTIVYSTWENTNSTGYLFYNRLIPDLIWGNGIVTIITNESVHYNAGHIIVPFNVSYIPTVTVESNLIGVLGYDTNIRLVVYDPNGRTISGIFYDFYNPEGEYILNGTSDLNGEIEFGFNIPENAEFGLQRYRIVIHSNSLLKVNGTSYFLEIAVRIPLRFTPTSGSWNVTRGENVLIQFMIESYIVQNQTVNIDLYDTNDEFSFLQTIATDVIETVNMSIGYHISLGQHRVLVIINDGDYQPIGLFEFELMVFTSFNFDIEIDTLFYDESLNFSISLSSDDIPPQFADVSAYFDSGNYSFTVPNITTDSLHFIGLSRNVFPGEHGITFNVRSRWYINISKQFFVFVWMRTTMHIFLSVLEDEINQEESGGFEQNNLVHGSDIMCNISLGSIMSPPPILFNGTTSVMPSTARVTSLESCPRLSSGTNNLSTVCANSLISLSGNGHNVRSLNDFKEGVGVCFSISSTDLEVQPYDTIPQSVVFGPEIKKSVNSSAFPWILDVIRRTRRL